MVKLLESPPARLPFIAARESVFDWARFHVARHCIKTLRMTDPLARVRGLLCSPPLVSRMQLRALVRFHGYPFAQRIKSLGNLALHVSGVDLDGFHAVLGLQPNNSFKPTPSARLNSIVSGRSLSGLRMRPTWQPHRLTLLPVPHGQAIGA